MARFRDPFAFSTSIVAKHQKIEGESFGEFFFEKKSHNAEKQKGIFWDFSKSILSQNINKLKGGLMREEKKSHKAEKAERGPFSLSRYCMLPGKKGKPFLVQFARPNYSIGDQKIS